MKVKKIIVHGYEEAWKDKLNDRIPFPLPKLFFNMLLMSPRNSGKTNLIVSMLLEGYKGIFNDVFVMCPTYQSCKTWKALKLNDEKIFNGYNDADLQSIIDYQNEPGNEKNTVLLIMDDLLGSIPKNSLFNSFITRNRHDRIALIITSQYSKGLLPIVRENLTSVITFNNLKPQEIEKLRDVLHHDYDLYYDKLVGTSKYNFIFFDWDQNALIMYNFNNAIINKDGTETIIPFNNI